MLRLIWKIILARRERTLLLALGVLIVSGTYGLLLSAVETTKLTVDKDLAQSWRTTYDILVRPAGSRSSIEEQYGLVQANHLNELNGGITLAQYKAIAALPNVEVAAPIAMLGYFNLVFQSPLDVECEPGFYKLENSAITDDGFHQTQTFGREFFYCAEAGGSFFHLYHSPYYNVQPFVSGLTKEPNSIAWPGLTTYHLPVLLAAIDPDQESRLVGLDNAIIEGTYLHNPKTSGEIPLILNTTSYVSFTLQTIWSQVDLALDAQTLAQVRAEGGEDYLAGLPVEPLRNWTYPGQDAYSYALATINDYRDQFNSLDALLGNLSYQEIPLPPGANGPALQVIPYGSGVSTGGSAVVLMPLENYTPEMRFRKTDVGAGMGGDLPFIIQGTYDIERLAQRQSTSEVPLETYYPPKVTLRYDANGKPVKPIVLGPTFSDTGYIISPPLALTTLKAGARLNFINQDKPISAIRVRVAGIEEFTPEAQRKIEQVASEIINRTGMDVDIMVGSSPRRVLVYIPGDKRVPPTGYVEEGWVQINVRYHIANEIQRVNVLLFSVMLLVSILYITNTSMMSILARTREIAIQKALGWRNAAVFKLIVSEAVLVGLDAGLLGLGLSFILAKIFRLHLPLNQAVWIVPLGLTLCILGSLVPASLAARIRPIQMLVRGEMTHSSLHLGKISIPGYALRQVFSRRWRLAFAILTIAAATGLMVVFLGATLYLRSYLTGTFLGEQILVHIGPIHYLIAAISFLIAGFAAADVLLMAVIERRREIGILKAVGWKERHILELFLWEAAGMAVISGLLGWLVGLIVFLIIYPLPLLSVLSLLLPALLIPVTVSLVFALYPAWQATRIPPAEVMRYE